MRRWVRQASVLVGTLLVGVCACGRPAQLRYEESVERTSGPARHALHDQRLRELMRGLERLRAERLPQAMDVAGEERRRRVEVERVARAMQQSAALLENVAPDERQAPESRREFLALAATLEARARELADEAGTLAPDAMQSRLRAIDATCEACHARFRASEGLRDLR